MTLSDLTLPLRPAEPRWDETGPPDGAPSLPAHGNREVRHIDPALPAAGGALEPLLEALWAPGDLA